MERSAARESTAYVGIFIVAAHTLLMTFALIADTAVNLARGNTGESGVTPGSLPYLSMTANTLLLLLPILIAPLAGRYGTGFGARLPRRPRAPRLLAATALTWLAMGATGVANPWLRHALGHEPWTGVSSTHQISDPEMTFLAANAGIGEEAASLAIPTGLVYMAGTLANLIRERTGKAPIATQRLWLLAATIGPGIALVSRVAGHLYQGPASAGLALVWGAALAAVFLWVRSIWPVMLGHFIYDIPVHYDSWAAVLAHHVAAPALLAATGIVVIYAFRSRPRDGPQVQLP